MGCIRTVPKQDWSTGFQYRIPVHLGLPVGTQAGVLDYQVKLDLQGQDLKLPLCVDFTWLKPDGTDIRFTDTDGKTRLSFWIQSWDNTNAQATVWVKVPEIKARQLKTIYLYYANPEAQNISSFTQTMTKLTADETTIGLWHFDEPKGEVRDSSKYNHHSVSLKAQRLGHDGYWPQVQGESGTIPQSPPHRGRGKGEGAGNALLFNGKDDYVKIVPSALPAPSRQDPFGNGKAGSLSFKAQDKLSLEAWVYPVTYSPHATILTKEGEYYLQVNETGNLACYLYGPRPETYHASNGTVPLNQWSHIALTYDGRSIKFYINERLDTTIEARGAMMPCLDKIKGIDYHNSTLWIGNYPTPLRSFGIAKDGYQSPLRRPDGEARSQPDFARTPLESRLRRLEPLTGWNGMLDEIRILKRVLSLEELKTNAEYRKYSPGGVNIKTGTPEKSTEWKQK